MKTNLCRALLLTGLIGFSAAAGHAQTLSVNVPFRFHTANTEMPAGKYTVHQISSSAIPILVLRNWDSQKSALVAATGRIESSSGDGARLVFRCQDSNCALSQIWGATMGGGVQLAVPKSSSERLSVVYFDRKPAAK